MCGGRGSFYLNDFTMHNYLEKAGDSYHNIKFIGVI